MDIRVQNLSWSCALFLLVEGVSNVTKQTRTGTLARVANVMSIIQMGFWVGYQDPTYELFTRSAFHLVGIIWLTEGNIAAGVADMILFYLMYELTCVYNLKKNKYIALATKIVFALSILEDIGLRVTAGLNFMTMI